MFNFSAYWCKYVHKCCSTKIGARIKLPVKSCGILHTFCNSCNIMQNQDIATQYNQIAEAYLIGQSGVCPKETWGRLQINRFIGDIEDKTILDAGCGDGLDTKSFLDRGAKEVLAFDPSEAMLASAKESTPAIHFEIGTYEAIPFTDQSADLVIGFFSLHYVFDLDLAFAEIHRVLKPGGRMAMICTHPAYMTMNKKLSTKCQEVTTFKIYNDTVTLTKPTHTLAEYFSPYFLSHFSLDNLDEFYPSNGQEGQQLRDPQLLAFSATKR